MNRSFGLPHHTEVSAKDQVQKDGWGFGKQPLPPGTPKAVLPLELGIKDDQTLRFLVFGDCGGVLNPGPQEHVAAAMATVIAEVKPAFALIVGDLIYFNGAPAQWPIQFYEPYATTLSGVPIIAFPGNHDGDPCPLTPGSGIASFMANMCTAKPEIPPGDPQFEYGRHTQTLPYCDWTLAAEAFTLITLWSNVPSGGHLYPSQTDYLTAQLKAARSTVPCIVGLHHPPYSVDSHHGGSLRMGKALDAAFAAARRCPELVLSGHVHNYQRFTRTVQDPVMTGGQKYVGNVTYLVSGNGGYHNLHKLAHDATPGLEVTTDTTFRKGDDKDYGFCVLTASPAGLTGEYVAVDHHSGTVIRHADTF